MQVGKILFTINILRQLAHILTRMLYNDKCCKTRLLDENAQRPTPCLSNCGVWCANSNWFLNLVHNGGEFRSGRV